MRTTPDSLKIQSIIGMEYFYICFYFSLLLSGTLPTPSMYVCPIFVDASAFPLYYYYSLSRIALLELVYYITSPCLQCSFNKY